MNRFFTKLATFSRVPLIVGVATVTSVITPTAIAATVIEEVVVTARKKAENLQEVPIAVTAFTESTISDAGIERPEDFIALTPNVTIVDTANAGDTQVTIRGITSTRDAESTFAYVVDGVLITNPNGFNQELFDIQQIEVLKGPQGALYGRNAVSGAILVNTKKPGDELEGKFGVGAGTDGLTKARVSFSGPIAPGLGGSIAISTRDEDGQFENDFTGEDDAVDYLEEDNIRARLVWDVSDQLTIDTNLGYRDVSGGAINFNAVFALPTAAALPVLGNPALYKDVNDHEFNYFFNVPGVNEQENTFFSVKADYDMEWATLTTIFAYDDLEEFLISDGTSAAFGLYSFDFGAAPSLTTGVDPAQASCGQTFNALDTSLFGSGDPFYSLGGAVPGTAADVSGIVGIPGAYGLNALLPPYSPTTCDGYQYQKRDQESTSLELRLAGETDGIEWVGGIYYADIEREVAVSYGSDIGDGNFPARPYVEGRTDLLFWDDFQTDVISIFGSAEWAIDPANTLTLAARYDDESREVSNKVPNVLQAAAFGGGDATGARINPAFVDATTTIGDRDEDYSQFQPKVSWSYQHNDDLQFYTSYGIGFRSGGFNNQGSADLIETAYAGIDTRPANLRDEYDKEVSESLELGFKSEWNDRRLRINGAVFRTEVEDNQFFNFLAGGFGILRVVTNIDEVVITGAELDFESLLTDAVTLYGSVGVVDSEIEKNSNRPYTEGNEAPLTPDMTANLGVQWAFPVADGMELKTRLDWQYVGETWFSTVQDNETSNAFTNLNPTYQADTDPTTFTIGDVFGASTAGPGVPAGDNFLGFGTSRFDKGQRDAYDLLNLRVTLETSVWSVAVWGNNILDEEYLSEVIPAPEFGGYFVNQARGESYGVDFVYNF